MSQSSESTYYAPPKREPTPPVGDMDYWGNMITEAQHPPQPMPKFRRLLLAIAEHIKNEIEPKDVKALTPVKMSCFYRRVGGDLDELFLDMPPEQISEIYTTLGCTHSLEPGEDDFHPPAIPALTARGFVIWQTVQLLLEPSEHIPYIRTAVTELKLRDPDTGELFPNEIPEEAFPTRPCEETRRWHSEVFEKAFLAKQEKQRQQQGKTAPPPPVDPDVGSADRNKWWEGSYYKSRNHRRRNHTKASGYQHTSYRRSAPADIYTQEHAYVYTAHPSTSKSRHTRHPTPTSTADATLGTDSGIPPSKPYVTISSDEEDLRGRRHEPDVEYIPRTSGHRREREREGKSHRSTSRTHSHSKPRAPKAYYVVNEAGIPIYTTTHTTDQSGSRHRHRHHLSASPPTQLPIPNLYHSHSSSSHVHAPPNLHTFASYPDLNTHAPPPLWTNTPGTTLNPTAAAAAAGIKIEATQIPIPDHSEGPEFHRHRSSSPPLGGKKSYPRPTQGPYSGAEGSRRSYHYYGGGRGYGDDHAAAYDEYERKERRRGRSESRGKRRYYASDDSDFENLMAGLEAVEVGEGWSSRRRRKDGWARERQREPKAYYL
ncbi:hypothetical protein EX30DRAFT_47234 [Ascodesmis nigricans]|uniref:DUF7514 domain-containing protein n=1 Tax=Ascodesmis nigricans TaxID=341454 RepID=A0A4S2MVN4_9PEZI|nr:hypothetical protein EX30DRAFT_47234 [Ascodesmis nigricans]